MFHFFCPVLQGPWCSFLEGVPPCGGAEGNKQIEQANMWLNSLKLGFLNMFVLTYFNKLLIYFFLHFLNSNIKYSAKTIKICMQQIVPPPFFAFLGKCFFLTDEVLTERLLK